jgi:hypothetical protein
MRSLFVALTAAFRKTVPTWFALFLLHCDATGPADVTVPVVDGVITSVDGCALPWGQATTTNWRIWATS